MEAADAQYHDLDIKSMKIKLKKLTDEYNSLHQELANKVVSARLSALE